MKVKKCFYFKLSCPPSFRDTERTRKIQLSVTSPVLGHSYFEPTQSLNISLLLIITHIIFLFIYLILVVPSGVTSAGVKGG